MQLMSSACVVSVLIQALFRSEENNQLCIDNKHDRFGCQFNSLVSEMGMGQHVGSLLKQNGW